MKLLIKILPVLLIVVTIVSSQKKLTISDLIVQASMAIYYPSFNQMIETADSMIRKFYGKNYSQMIQQFKMQSISSYEVDIFDPKSLKNIGINPNGEIAFVHIEKDLGYLILTIDSEAKFKKYAYEILGNVLPYRFIGKYVILSQNENKIQLSTNYLINKSEFQLSAKKLKYNWKKPFVWVEGGYLSEVSSATGVSKNINIPQGFSMIQIDYQTNKILLNTYSGMIHEKQVNFLKVITMTENLGKFDIFDYIEPEAAAIGQVNLNMPIVYRYYSYIDKIGVLGITDFFKDIETNYQVNIQRDLIHNSDGRAKLAIYQFDQDASRYNIIGSLGIKNKDIAKSFISSLNTAFVNSGEELFSFDLFTHPIYHLKRNKYSIYFGLIEHDFIFATDKDTLTKVVKNIYENNVGGLENYPEFFKNASVSQQRGFFGVVDIQSMISKIKYSGLNIAKEFLMGTKDIFVSGFPDNDETPYGWIVDVSINFYEK